VRLDLGLDRRPDTGDWEFRRMCAALRIPPLPERPATPAEVVESLVFDQTNRDSVLACITAARDNARQVREEISSGMWEQLNALFLRVQQARKDGTWLARPHFLSRLIIEGVHLFEGVTDATMGHGEGWQYLQAGRFLERASATAVLLDLQFRDGAPLPAHHVEWVGLLRSCSALEAYCRCYTADLRPERIAEFLLLNPEFPRSVRFAAARAESALRAIGQLTGRGAGGRAERLAGRFHASLDYGQVDEILDEDPHKYLETIGRYATQIHTAIYQTYIMYPIESALPA
jgi:uncharacterized alpha-E superfamily protein